LNREIFEAYDKFEMLKEL